ncbi:Calcium uniporter protein, mitochondrial [Liparis tanakae]|uniref:Calcium uniporter protein, mitochondrial n=1 Tax=Liparis tanakae TaxID=230148 RepID=A0A4Z2HMB2_9TELE|nr:Calcium uniporter protein, mitochondrial [Liparis tanakae]
MTSPVRCLGEDFIAHTHTLGVTSRHSYSQMLRSVNSSSALRNDGAETQGRGDTHAHPAPAAQTGHVPPLLGGALHESGVSFAHWRNTGHVCEAVVQPRSPPTTLPLPFGASRSARSSLLSRRAFTPEMAAKVCRSVLLLSRSSGAVAGCLPALAVSSQRHHQHIRPVSPRTSGAHGERCRTGQAGWLDPEREQRWRLGWLRNPSTPHRRCPAVYCNPPSDTLPRFHTTPRGSRALRRSSFWCSLDGLR